MKITDIDTNFSLEHVPGDLEAVYYDVRQAPFAVFGVAFEDGMFRRMPADTAKEVSDGVKYLSTNTAGGRVAFKTDSPFVILLAELGKADKMPHFTTLGSCGFDLYADGEFYKPFIPRYGVTAGFDGLVRFSDTKPRELLIHFPLYSDVRSLRIGLAPGAGLWPCSPYKPSPPVVYYGSSITQGGCASRPGNAYPAIISMQNRMDYVNLGFSGNALGEKKMAEYIAGLDMGAFVLDYDHNAPTVEHLEQTHERFYRIVRDRHPAIPVLMVSRPDFTCTEENARRREIVRHTCRMARRRGEKAVFVDGKAMFDNVMRGACTVDGSHPNDLGFYYMAQYIGEALKAASADEKPSGEGVVSENAEL